MKGLSLLRSLPLSVAIVGFLTAFAAVMAGAVLFRAADRLDFYENCYRDTNNVLLSSLDPRFQTKAEEVARVAERMVVVGAIKGGIIFDATGHQLQSFGERTEVDFQTILTTGRRIFRPAAGSRLEFYFSPDVSRTPFHLVVRYATNDVDAMLAAKEERMLGVALGAGLASGLTVALFLLLFVTRPLGRIGKAIDVAIADPANAGSSVPLRASKTEIGDVVMSVECMRSTLADIWHNKVLVAQSILEASPFAIVQMNADGLPLFANPASIALFERDVSHAYATGTNALMVKDIESGQSLRLKAFVDQFNESRRLVELASSTGSRFALMTSRTRAQSGRAPMTLLVASDVTEMHVGRLTAESHLESSLGNLKLAGLKEFELKMMLEGCLMLIGGAAGPEIHTDAAPIARDWLEAAREEGFVARFECEEAGPMVAGGAENLRGAVRLALIAAAARCGSVPVVMNVAIRGINFETVGMEITARPAEGTVFRASGIDANLALAALRVGMRRIGGLLGEVTSDESGTVLRLTLRGAAERMATAMAKTAKS